MVPNSSNRTRRDLSEALAAVENGAKLVVPVDYGGVAMEATRGLIRRGVKALYLITLPTSSLQADLLIGAGCVRLVETAAVSFGELWPAPRFVAKVIGGTVAIKDAT